MTSECTAGIGRFAGDLPPVDRFVGLGEGATALIALPSLAAHLGIRGLWAKLESLNPTGSYKDRVAAMSVSLALQQGKAGWIATSSGNAGQAMAAYGARAGLPGFVCLVASAPTEKRRALVPYGVDLVRVTGVGHGASPAAEEKLFESVRTAALRHDLYLGITAHAFNPQGMRGIDTIAYELAEQLPGVTHVYVPTGGGGLLTAVARGLAHRGMAGTRVIACQPSGCAPIARHLRGELPEPMVEACRSDISALQLPRPPDGPQAARSVRASGGWGTHVPDESILDAARSLAAEGVFVEAAAAVSLAAAVDDARAGRLGNDAQVVLVLTGAGWKDLTRSAGHLPDDQPVAVAAVPDIVDRWARTLSVPARQSISTAST